MEVRSKDLAATDSPASWDAVPWALRVFTAEFGMGSGALPLAIATKSFERTLCLVSCVGRDRTALGDPRGVRPAPVMS